MGEKKKKKEAARRKKEAEEKTQRMTDRSGTSLVGKHDIACRS
jgi:hypothetical protein